ncbi:SDR family NAD(P)-dependent oxidoreductase [Leifsonia sp. NPDC058292]|uniref:SDR family NAD(P)-dependent oxidoreductase n=1 Tax=Leifsonia sp. NPDC058292 TaxID=3346428 RepID=UPI0036DF4D66
MTRRFDGRTALVTGSTNGIGKAIAEAFAAEGAYVVVSGRSTQRGGNVVAGIRERGGRAQFVPAHLDGTPATARQLANEAGLLLGAPIDILVNNAGIYPPHSTASVDEELFDRIFDVNVKSAFFLTQAVVPDMISLGSGVVINLGSWVSRLAVSSSPLYSSSKATMEALTRAWSAEFGPQGVRVNAISPGVIHDPGSESVGGGLMDGAPAGTPGRPTDIAAAAAFLASDEAAFVHGATLNVDGGRASVLLSRR